MQTLDKKFEDVLAAKEEALKKLKDEFGELHRLRRSIQNFPLNWHYDVTSKNAERVAVQSRILHSLFNRHDELKTIKRPRSNGLSTHQIWKKLYPTHTGTSSATFRGHLSDLKKKRLVKKCEDGEFWMATPRALEKRIGGKNE